jgi:hypothetical protein
MICKICGRESAACPRERLKYVLSVSVEDCWCTHSAKCAENAHTNLTRYDYNSQRFYLKGDVEDLVGRENAMRMNGFNRRNKATFQPDKDRR